MADRSNELSVPGVEFDESWYLKAYPDIAQAIRAGIESSGLSHYLKFGRAEGRLPYLFDPTWYASTYPGVAEEAGGTEAHLLYRHFRSIGAPRGYRPHPKADRPKDAAAIESAFGGLWIDHANATDLIAGKRDIGRIDARQAALLSFFVKHGYVIVSGLIPPALVDRAEEALHAAYAGKIGNLLFECPRISAGHCAWAADVCNSPAKALDLHWLSNAVRDIVLCEAVTDFLHLVFERRALVSQTLGFWRGSAQPLHQDSAYVPYSLPRNFVASWVALEDVVAGAGELEYLPGSHRALSEFSYPGGYKSVFESARNGTAEAAAAAVPVHGRQITIEGRRLSLAPERFLAKRGDVLFWHSDLAHGGSPISTSRTRKSLVTHYCPREVAPLFFEQTPARVCRHASGDYYTSGVYVGRVPA